MNNYINLSYWFNSRPETLSPLGQKILISIAAIMGIIFIIIAIKAYGEKLKLYRPSINKLLPFCLTNLLISLYLYFVSYELVPVLRARIWFVIWLLIAIFWIIRIVKDFFKRAKRRVELSKEEQIKKYLP